MSKPTTFMSKLFKRKQKEPEAEGGLQKSALSSYMATDSNGRGTGSHGNQLHTHSNQRSVQSNSRTEKEVKVTILKSHQQNARVTDQNKEASVVKTAKKTTIQTSVLKHANEQSNGATRHTSGTKLSGHSDAQIRNKPISGSSTQNENGHEISEANRRTVGRADNRMGATSADRRGNMPQAATPSNGVSHNASKIDSENVDHYTDERFPEKARALQHRTHCYLPAPLAAVLRANPHLVAPMVHAFYYRDPVDLKACVTFNTFRPGTRVLSEVRMTKCLYAQLMQQQFTPDRRSGYTLPPRNSPSYRAHDLGVKLAHGAEILCSRCSAPAAPSSQPGDTSRWSTFLQALTHKGYFKGEIEGSQLHSQLVEEARRFFGESSSLQNADDTNPGYRILELVQSEQWDVEDMRKKEKELPPPDDDSWLTLSPQQLDDMLTDAYRDVFHAARPAHPEHVAGGVKAFVNQRSSHQGAEFPGEEDDDEVTFDPNSFIQTMQKMFDFKDEKDTSSEDDMSEYGSDLDPDEMTPGGGSGRGGKEEEEEMRAYMEQMDRELARTNIGQSFTNTQNPVAPPRHKKKQKSANSTSSQNPSSTTPPKSDSPQKSPHKERATANTSHQTRAKPAPRAQLEDDFDVDDLDEEFEPVNVDVNLVHNLLESHAAQQGLAGPASNMLGGMGLQLPHRQLDD